MAFDAKAHVADILTGLDDKLKQAKAKQEAEALANAKEVAVLEAEIAGWQSLLADAAPKKPAKK